MIRSLRAILEFCCRMHKPQHCCCFEAPESFLVRKIEVRICDLERAQEFRPVVPWYGTNKRLLFVWSKTRTGLFQGLCHFVVRPFRVRSNYLQEILVLLRMCPVRIKLLNATALYRRNPNAAVQQ